MLLQITIKNFAIFRDAVIEPESGYNVITGESGAGKSVVVNAMSLICGARAYREMIRTGEKNAVVEAVFRIPDRKRKILSDKFDINDDLLVITREIYRDKPSLCKINGRIRNLSQIISISSIFIDIHGQYENQTLLDVDNHIKYLDEFGHDMLRQPLSEYKLLKNKYDKIVDSIIDVSGGDAERERQKQILEFQINEINEAEIEDVDESAVIQRRILLENAEKFRNATAAALNLIESEDKSVVTDIGAAIKEIESLPENETLNNSISALKDSYYQVQDAVSEIKAFNESIEFNDSEYENILDQLNRINNLKKKYGGTIPEIVEFRQKAEEQLEKINNFSKNYSKSLEKLKALESELNIKDDKLTKIRKSSAEKLIKSLLIELHEMGMKDAVIKILFNKTNRSNVLGFSIFPKTGKDECEFLISLNKGLEPITLGKVASGGEMSRIMLSFKTVFSYKDDTQTVVFDEIDSGISGEASIAVADKLEKLSKDRQIICITHLPQIAARADTNFNIRKSTENKISNAAIIKVSGIAEKIDIIAELTDGENITPEGREHAQKLLRENKKYFQ